MKKLLLLSIFLLINIEITAQNDFTSSNLPIIVINTGGKVIVDEPKIVASMGIIDNGIGKRNSLSDLFNGYNGKIGIEIRGHSSQMFPKKQYGIELWDDSGNSVDAPLLGMPAESDWVLNASFLDRTFLRNTLAYKLSNDMGRYATRTRFCEVLINNQYMGIYILQEKIKRDKNRVNIKKMEPTDISGDPVTGGYILQIDRIDPGTKYFNSVFPSVYPKTPSQPSPISYLHVYPNSNDIVPAQQDYIRNYITDFETSLSKSTYTDPFLGYYNYVDLEALVDYILATEFTKTVDAYRLSTYLTKKRDSEGGKLLFGPMWDYDLAFGLAEYANGWPTSGWQADTSPYEGIWSNPFWIRKIFNDPVIKNKLAKRWNELKSTVFDLSNIIKYIDQTAENITEARIRNFNRWPIIGVKQWIEYFLGQTYDEDLLYLKGWIIHRYDWMNSNLPESYSNVDWIPVDLSKINLASGKTSKFPLSSFVKNTKNITSLEFVANNPNLLIRVAGDSVSITPSNNGQFVFKGIARKNNTIVCISPEYKLNLVTGIEKDLQIPKAIELIQNYPNPFNPETTITFFLSTASHVMLKVHDLLGREIATLVDEFKQPGIYKSKFSIKQLRLSSGIYYYTLKAGNYFQSKKMVLLK